MSSKFPCNFVKTIICKSMDKNKILWFPFPPNQREPRTEVEALEAMFFYDSVHYIDQNNRANPFRFRNMKRQPIVNTLLLYINQGYSIGSDYPEDSFGDRFLTFVANYWVTNERAREKIMENGFDTNLIYISAQPYVKELKNLAVFDYLSYPVVTEPFKTNEEMTGWMMMKFDAKYKVYSQLAPHQNAWLADIADAWFHAQLAQNYESDWPLYNIGRPQHAPPTHCEECCEPDPKANFVGDTKFVPHYQLPELANRATVEWLDVRNALMRKLPEGIPYETITQWCEAITYLARAFQKHGAHDLTDIRKSRDFLSSILGERHIDEPKNVETPVVEPPQVGQVFMGPGDLITHPGVVFSIEAYPEIEYLSVGAQVTPNVNIGCKACVGFANEELCERLPACGGSSMDEDGNGVPVFFVRVDSYTAEPKKELPKCPF